MKKTLLIVLAVLLFVVSLALTISAAYSFRSRVIPPALIEFRDIDLRENSLEITGIFPLDSLNVYKKYKYDIRDSGVYITIYGGPGQESSDDFHINILDDFSSVKKVYLVGEDQQRLMYSLDE